MEMYIDLNMPAQRRRSTGSGKREKISLRTSSEGSAPTPPAMAVGLYFLLGPARCRSSWSRAYVSMRLYINLRAGLGWQNCRSRSISFWAGLVPSGPTNFLICQVQYFRGLLYAARWRRGNQGPHTPPTWDV
jgi:hypothetical protein